VTFVGRMPLPTWRPRGRRNRASWLPWFWAALFAATAASLPGATAQPRPPNVLFIATDDLNSALGCLGDPVAKTPHIDRLARSGVLFTRAYCQQPLCNPSRASMLTGLRPDTLRVWDLQTDFRTNKPRVGTIPQMFHNQGYFSARVGKIFHYGVPRQIGSGGMDDANSWDLAVNPRGRDKDEEDQLHVLTRGTGTTLGFAMAWREMDGSDTEQTDGIAVDETIRVLERYGNKPLWLGMGFFRPHTPFVATKKWFDLYPKKSFKLPENPPGETDDIPPVAMKIVPPNYALSESDLLDCVRGYYASVAFVDDQVGKLMAALERLNLIDNTIVVFFSDHGFLLGEHGQWQKEMLFEEAARVPLIIVPPGGWRRPKSDEREWKSHRVVELLDVYPTLVEMAGLKPPRQKLEGRSLVPLLKNPQAASDRAALTQTPRRVKNQDIMGYSIRTARWRYTEWGNNGEHGRELYDHDNDPREFNNLAKTGTPTQAAISELKIQMEALKAVSRNQPKDPE
jgi:iduronate 2-sulfatase